MKEHIYRDGLEKLVNWCTSQHQQELAVLAKTPVGTKAYYAQQAKVATIFSCLLKLRDVLDMADLQAEEYEQQDAVSQAEAYRAFRRSGGFK